MQLDQGSTGSKRPVENSMHVSTEPECLLLLPSWRRWCVPRLWDLPLSFAETNRKWITQSFFILCLDSRKQPHNPLGSRQEAQGYEPHTKNASEEDEEVTIRTFSSSLEGQHQLQTDVWYFKWQIGLCIVQNRSTLSYEPIMLVYFQFQHWRTHRGKKKRERKKENQLAFNGILAEFSASM